MLVCTIGSNAGWPRPLCCLPCLVSIYTTVLHDADALPPIQIFVARTFAPLQAEVLAESAQFAVTRSHTSPKGLSGTKHEVRQLLMSVTSMSSYFRIQRSLPACLASDELLLCVL